MKAPVIMTPAKGRHELFDLYCSEIKRHGIPVYVVTEDKVCKDIATHHHHQVVGVARGLALGAKLNRGLNKVKAAFDWSHLMVVGSDDFLNPDWLTLKVEQGEVLASNTLYVMSWETKQIKRVFNRRTYGAGRIISRNVLELVPKPWPDNLNKGLDYASERNFQAHGFYLKNTPTPAVLDVKTKGQNIGRFDWYLGQPDVEPLEIPQFLTNEGWKKLLDRPW